MGEYYDDYYRLGEEDDFEATLPVVERYLARAADNPSCYECGGTTRRTGSRYVCEYCGESTGCD